MDIKQEQQTGYNQSPFILAKDQQSWSNEKRENLKDSINILQGAGPLLKAEARLRKPTIKTNMYDILADKSRRQQHYQPYDLLDDEARMGYHYLMEMINFYFEGNDLYQSAAVSHWFNTAGVRALSFGLTASCAVPFNSPNVWAKHTEEIDLHDGVVHLMLSTGMAGLNFQTYLNRKKSIETMVKLWSDLTSTKLSSRVYHMKNHLYTCIYLYGDINHDEVNNVLSLSRIANSVNIPTSNAIIYHDMKRKDVLYSNNLIRRDMLSMLQELEMFWKDLNLTHSDFFAPGYIKFRSKHFNADGDWLDVATMPDLLIKPVLVNLEYPKQQYTLTENELVRCMISLNAHIEVLSKIYGIQLFCDRNRKPGITESSDLGYQIWSLL